MAGDGVTTADSWNTHPKELSPSLKAVVQSRDRGDNVTRCVQRGNTCGFLGGQQTAEERCDSQPSTGHVQPYLGQVRLGV